MWKLKWHLNFISKVINVRIKKVSFYLYSFKKYVRNRVTNVMFCNVTYYTFITTLLNTPSQNFSITEVYFWCWNQFQNFFPNFWLPRRRVPFSIILCIRFPILNLTILWTILCNFTLGTLHQIPRLFSAIPANHFHLLN